MKTEETFLSLEMNQLSMNDLYIQINTPKIKNTIGSGKQHPNTQMNHIMNHFMQ